MNKIFSFSLLLVFLASYIHAQVLTPVKWKFSTEKISDDTYRLIYTAQIDKGWSVYSQYTGDDGPVPTEIVYENQEGIEVIGKSIEEGHKKEGFDKLFETNVIKFVDDEPFVIKQEVKLTNSSANISGYLTYMTCDDTKCLPPTDVDFNFSLSRTNKKAKAGGIEESSPKTPEEDVAGISINLPEEESLDQNLTFSNQSNKSGILEPVKWSFQFNELKDGEYELNYSAAIDAGWTVYSQFTSDDGPVPTEVVYEELNGYVLDGPSVESGHRKEGYDKLFEVNVVKFLSDKPYTIIQKLKSDQPSGPVKGYLTYMACDSEKCLPPTDVEFSFNLNESTIVLATESSGLAKIEGEVIDQLIPSLASTYKDPLSNCEEGASESKNLLWTFFFGFIGGLLALLTPCVFPMIPITVSFFTKDTRRKGWMNGLIYGASIIFIYVVLGLLITILLGPEALNRLSTNWIANSIFFVIFIAFAFSFFGFYEITLPSSWSTKSDQMADKGGLIGIFFMAATLALVSFSCTGPIIGTAIVQAASQGEYSGPFSVMLGFSTALALPFGLFAAFPAWLNTLPRSGSWMNSVKVVLGFLELALALKFLSVADMTNHWGFLRYELFLGLWILVFLGMTAYLFGFIKFPHDSPIKKLSLIRKAFGLSALAFTIYLGTGFFINKNTNSYNALSLMSGLAPPANYNYFLPADQVDLTIKEKYPSYSKCANNIDCFKDYYDALAYAKEVNKPLLVDFTGYGCVNCRKTEEHIWVDEEIRRKLNEDVVLVSLYVDDDKKLDPVYISKSRNVKLRNVGKKWADFQIVNFEQNSQPLYVLVTPEEKVITSPRPYKEGIEEYNAFLECGLKSFEQIEEND
jgi:thiol:disulfide interchange protein DsbD